MATQHRYDGKTGQNNDSKSEKSTRCKSLGDVVAVIFAVLIVLFFFSQLVNENSSALQNSECNQLSQIECGAKWKSCSWETRYTGGSQYQNNRGYYSYNGNGSTTSSNIPTSCECVSTLDPKVFFAYYLVFLVPIVIAGYIAFAQPACDWTLIEYCFWPLRCCSPNGWPCCPCSTQSVKWFLFGLAETCEAVGVIFLALEISSYVTYDCTSFSNGVFASVNSVNSLSCEPLNSSNFTTAALQDVCNSVEHNVCEFTNGRCYNKYDTFPIWFTLITWVAILAFISLFVPSCGTCCYSCCNFRSASITHSKCIWNCFSLSGWHRMYLGCYYLSLHKETDIEETVLAKRFSSKRRAFIATFVALPTLVVSLLWLQKKGQLQLLTLATASVSSFLYIKYFADVVKVVRGLFCCMRSKKGDVDEEQQVGQEGRGIQCGAIQHQQPTAQDIPGFGNSMNPPPAYSSQAAMHGPKNGTSQLPAPGYPPQQGYPPSQPNVGYPPLPRNAFPPSANASAGDKQMVTNPMYGFGDAAS
eukprot:m.345222 g.345222  ORF g.345222 m.345222 type:complete len:528 (-) comp20659_c0_seq1:199-1782(-)